MTPIKFIFIKSVYSDLNSVSGDHNDLKTIRYIILPYQHRINDMTIRLLLFTHRTTRQG